MEGGHEPDTRMTLRETGKLGLTPRVGVGPGGPTQRREKKHLHTRPAVTRVRLIVATVPDSRIERPVDSVRRFRQRRAILGSGAIVPTFEADVERADCEVA